MDLTSLIEFTTPGSVKSVKRSPDGVKGDPWPGPGINDWDAAAYQGALDTLVTWSGVPPTGAAVHGNIAAWQASIPTQAELDELRKEQQANADLDMAVNKTIRDALWDMELRLRAAGQNSAGPDIAAATTKADYTTVLKDRVKGYLP